MFREKRSRTKLDILLDDRLQSRRSTHSVLVDNQTSVLKIGKASEQDIIQHLLACKNQFVPPLEFDLEVYAQKIDQHAETLEAWGKNELVGLVAVYMNNPPIGYITNVSVLPSSTGNGIARLLLTETETLAVEKGLTHIDLEVNKANTKALGLYKSMAYTQTKASETTLFLRKTL